MDTDGPPPPKSNSFNTLNNLQQQQQQSASSSSSVITNNNNANTNKAKQEEERRQQNEEEEYEQKLIKQLSNLSTQEIKRELEHTHSISTVALRGKHMLVKTLVNARIRKKKKSDVNDKKKKGENVGNVSTSKSSVARTTNSDYNTGSSNSINMNHGPDIKTMGVSEIKRELQLYGITTDGFLEKRELEETLLRERSLRIPPTSSGTKSGESNTSFGVHVIPGVGNVKQSSSSSSSTPSVSATQLNMSSSSSDNNNQNNNIPEYIYDSQQSPNDRAKLRELQIAYEFERVQSLPSWPEPTDIQYELETKFNISTKYFIGIKEMGYALAVARVDNMIERQLLGLSADGCVVDKFGKPVPTREGVDCSTDEDGDDLFQLPSAEELVAMEYENLYNSWDEVSLSEELENQYGIPAKHFMGKKEMAYALAVERVDRAIKEGGLIMDDYEDDDDELYGVMTDEDMMKILEEEMKKEEEEERKDRENRRMQLRTQSSFGGDGTGSKKTFTKEEPNPFQKTRPSYQSTPLADMIKDDTKGKRRRRSQPKRTPISSEPPHSFGRSRQQRQNAAQMGSVIGEHPSSSSSFATGGTMNNSNNKQSLADILKGSEQQQKSRSRPIRPPPIKTFKTSSARVDESFRPPPPNSFYGNNSRGYNTAWGKQGPMTNNASSSSYNNASASNNRGYSASWNKGPQQYASGSTAASSGTSSRSSANTQRPFEPAPFTQPGTHNAQGSASRHEPQRVPPQTPFTSPVTDGARGMSGGGSQGPFTPFTPPPKRSTNGKPPSQKRPSDPRGFNIKDTPDNTQPFVGSQAYFDQNTAYSPPLQVDPPPRDPNYEPKKRPFEPAPFSNPQPHAVRTDRAYRPPRDKWNRVNNNYSPPPPHTRVNPRQDDRQKQTKQRVGSSAFNNLKDMFSNMNSDGSGKKGAEKKVEKPKGFKSGNVEVFSSTDNEWPPKDISRQQNERLQQALEVEIIDAEMETTEDWQFEEEDDINQSSSPQPSTFDTFSNAWKGGPKSSSSFTANGGGSNEVDTVSYNNIVEDNTNGSGMTTDDTVIIQKAQQLLTSNPEIRAIVTRAQSNSKIREAVRECMDNPSSFGQYLNDAEVGPILNELRDCILIN